MYSLFCCLTELGSSVIIFKLVIIKSFVVLFATMVINIQIKSDDLEFSPFYKPTRFWFYEFIDFYLDMFKLKFALLLALIFKVIKFLKLWG